MTANEKERVVDTYRVMKKFYTVNWELLRNFYPLTEIGEDFAKVEAFVVTQKMHNLTWAQVQAILDWDWTKTHPRQLWEDRKS